MSWWWKLTVSWPAAFGDWLWVVLVERPAALLNRMTFRRAIVFILTFLVMMLVAQAFPLDLAFLFAGDLMFYLELSAVVWLIAARGNLKGVIRLAAELARKSYRSLLQAYCRARVRATVVRNNGKGRGRRLAKESESDEDPYRDMKIEIRFRSIFSRMSRVVPRISVLPGLA